MKKYTVFLIGALLLCVGSPKNVLAANEDTLGHWATLSDLVPINPIHTALLPNGRILFIAGSEFKSGDTLYSAAVWDREKGIWHMKVLDRDLFCNAMSFFPDGRLLITGGTKTYNPFTGEDTTTIFDWTTGQFTDGPKMAYGRWYPTNTVLSDGSTVTISGLGDEGINQTTEIFTPQGRPNIGTWSLPRWLSFVPTVYPRGHLLPTGKVFYSGQDQTSRLFDPATWTWSTVAPTVSGSRAYGTSVLLPLRPTNGYVAKVLIAGGNTPATSSVEVINLSSPTPSWHYVASMHEARIQLNATLTPDGKVVVTGGSKVNNDASTASLSAEIYDPTTTHAWTTGASETYPRLYHSGALLLPNAKILVFGSNPYGDTYEHHLEVYAPPYLYTKDAGGNVIFASRPFITSAPAEIAYGKTFAVSSADANTISQVVLIRLGAVTHAFNMEQRLVGLIFSNTGAGTLTVTAPPTGAVAPPGYYMLFINNNKGVPSVANFVHLK